MSNQYMRLILLLAVTICGCSRQPTFEAQIVAAGGAEVLKQESLTFVETFRRSEEKEYNWTNFPPAIASLRPQFVSILRFDKILLVNVQITGGFNHHGILLTSSTLPKDFQPRVSSFRVWQITNGIWEYKE